MGRQIIVEVYEYDAETPEDAEKAVRESASRYEHPTFVYAASSLDDLPHPAQIPAIRERIGD
jgi:hypothetical protein